MAAPSAAQSNTPVPSTALAVSSLPPLHVTANGAIVDNQNQPVFLRGINRSGVGSGNADATTTDADYAAASQLLSMNLVRLFVNTDWWMNNVTVPIADMKYQDYIDALIQRSEKYGNYVMIVKAGQFPDPPCGADSRNCPMPNQGDVNCQAKPAVCPAQDTSGLYDDAAFSFWAAFAKRYASDPAVLYYTWEEMHDIDSGAWANDQNQIIAAIRDYSPQSLIFVGNAGAAFESIVAGQIPDLAWSNIIWDAHIFAASNVAGCSQVDSPYYASWPQVFAPIVTWAQQNGHAVSITEWGGCNNQEPYNTNIVSFAQAHSIALAYFDAANLFVKGAAGLTLTPSGMLAQQAYAGLTTATPGGSLGQNVQYVSGSTTPLIQLTGENFQISSNGAYFSAPTPGQTLSRSGVLGTDLAYPIVYPDKIVFLFGDTMGAYQSGGRYINSPAGGPNGADDSIGYIPNVDLSQCHYIGDVDQQLAQGVAKPNAGIGACPAVQFYSNPTHPANQHVFKAITIAGLLTGETLGPYRVPTAGLNYNDRVYVFYITEVQLNAQPPFALQSIVAKSDQSPASWSDSNPPTFTRLYTVSSHPTVPDPNNPPPAAGDSGKFMFNPPVVMDSATLAAAGLTPGLPAALQSAPNVVFLFGSSYSPSKGSLYLAAFSLSDIEAGTSKWFYYKGVNQWSNNERDAAPLLANNVNVGNHSVVWNSALQRFILMHDPGIVAQFSPAPWGPWSSPVTLFTRNDNWGMKLLHHPGQDQIVRSSIAIYDTSGNAVDLMNDVAGVPYSPNLLDKFTQNGDGSVTVYFTMSTWNPYEAFLMSSTFTLAGP
jgi:hypothetical protein